MAALDEVCLPPAWRSHELWAMVAAHTLRWLAAHGHTVRDAVLLLPYAALLPPAREAFAQAGGWQPRVETPLTLAAALAPPAPLEPGQCSGEPTLDRLAAAALLRRQAWGAEREAHDRAGFEHIVAGLVDAAQALRSAAHERAPAGRPAFWAAARGQLGAATSAGPAGAERLLLRVALEWAAAAGPVSTDVLFTCRPSAWIVLRLGGADALCEALLGAGLAPGLTLLADPPADEPFAPVCRTGQLARVVCVDFEAEAQAAAAEVIEALNAGRTPVALVALDRSLVRRVRALLERAAVPLVDETGWPLSTTRAAARVVGLLRAAQPGAAADARLGWLKDWPPAAPAALRALEAQWRGSRRVAHAAAAEQLWAAAQAHLQPLAGPGTRSLAEWLARLHERLAADGSLAELAADTAGQQVLLALGLAPAGDAWRHAVTDWQLDSFAFTAWIESTLEQARFLPLPDGAAAVVLTPLSRAVGRPFGQVVIPGADDHHLGAIEPPPALIGDRLATALGLQPAAERRTRQRLALSHLLRTPAVTLLRRLRDGQEPLAESPDVEWLLLARAQAGSPELHTRAWQPACAPRAAHGTPRPRPVVAEALPATLSASQVEALRQCPYRFFARAVLRLDEAEELAAGLDKRDYGTWLHAVLHRFHSLRSAAGGGTHDDSQRLQQAAEHSTVELHLDAGELLPYRASFENFAPAYLAWLAEREQQGWVWQAGEADCMIEPAALGGTRLRGRLDRLDTGPGGQRQLIDYKTGSLQSLRDKVGAPLEDTQLAFYAALLGNGGDGGNGGGSDSDGRPLSATYLALDDAKAPCEVPHPEVQRSAAELVQQLGGELARMRQGTPLPALGEGRVCETCEARGLCRRDHWGAS